MSEHTLEIHRSQWHNDDLALICGIANAGGGYLIVGGSESTRAKNVRRMNKAFESIPQLTQQTLGFVCPAEPIMDGPHLCLEIAIPAATEPVNYDGLYYLYTSSGNKLLEGEELNAFLHQGLSHGSLVEKPVAAEEDSPQSEYLDNITQPESDDAAHLSLQTTVPQKNDSVPARKNGTSSAKKTPSQGQKVPVFKERSIAASNNLYLTYTDEYVLKVLTVNGRATAPKIASLLGISESTVRRSFRRLKNYGMIERVGSDKAGYWKVLL